MFSMYSFFIFKRLTLRVVTSLVVGWLVGWLVGGVHCGQTVHPRPIVTMEH